MRIRVYSGRPRGRGSLPPLSEQGSIVLSQSSVSRSVVEGSTTPIVVDIQVTDGGPGAMSAVSVGTPSEAWLTAQIDSAAPPANITLTMDPTGLLESGSPYTATVQVTAANASNSPRTITWQQTITAAGGGGVTVVNGTLQRWDGGTGSVLVSNGFPLRPGDMTEADVTAREFTVEVNGVEQAVWCEAMRGRHNDGTVRSLLVQFNYNIPDATPIPCQFKIGQVRSTTDLGAVTATRLSNTVSGSGATLTWKAAALATDAEYLCATEMTGKPLMSLARMQTEDPDGYAFFKTAWDIHYNDIKTQSIGENNDPGATYDSNEAMYTHYLLTGDPFWWWEGVRRALWKVTGYFGQPAGATSYNPNPNVFAETEYAGATGIAPPEQHTQVYHGFAIAYLTTGYASFWALVNARCQYAVKSSWTSQAAVSANSSGVHTNHYGPRFNAMRFQPVLAAHMIDATRKISTPSGGNLFVDFPTHLPRILQAYLDHAYSTADYRDGLAVGSTGSTDMAFAIGDVAGDFPVFQTNLPALDFIHYYLNIHADSRIPAMVKGCVDAVLLNAVTPLASNYLGTGLNDVGLNVATYGTTYALNATAGRDGPPFSEGSPSTTLASGVSAGASTFTVADATGFAAGQLIRIGTGGTLEYRSIRTVAGTSITIGQTLKQATNSPLLQGHSSGEAVVRQTLNFDGNYWIVAPYTLPEVVTGCAFLKNLYPSDVVNGHTYAEWYAIVVDPANTQKTFLTWNWKLIGQLYGRHQGAPSLFIDGLPGSLPASIRVPTNHTTWPP